MKQYTIVPLLLALALAGGTRPALKAQDRAEAPPMEVEVVTIDDFTASPDAIHPKHGPFILSLVNRVRSGPAELALDSPNIAAADLTSLSASMKLSLFPGVRRLDSVMNAPPGIYELKWKATGQVRLTITIE